MTIRSLTRFTMPSAPTMALAVISVLFVTVGSNQHISALVLLGMFFAGLGLVALILDLQMARADRILRNEIRIAELQAEIAERKAQLPHSCHNLVERA